MDFEDLKFWNIWSGMKEEFCCDSFWPKNIEGQNVFEDHFEIVLFTLIQFCSKFYFYQIKMIPNCNRLGQLGFEVC